MRTLNFAQPLREIGQSAFEAHGDRRCRSKLGEQIVWHERGHARAARMRRSRSGGARHLFRVDHSGIEDVAVLEDSRDDPVAAGQDQFDTLGRREESAGLVVGQSRKSGVGTQVPVGEVLARPRAVVGGAAPAGAGFGACRSGEPPRRRAGFRPDSRVQLSLQPNSPSHSA